MSALQVTANQQKQNSNNQISEIEINFFGSYINSKF